MDGATFTFIREWTREGKLPALKKILERGVSCNLHSTIPPVTPIAWPTFMTGKNPGKHGIFDWVSFNPESYYRFNNSSIIKSKTFWELAGEQGKKCIVVNVPVTYPPYQVNGALVTGLLTPEDQTFTYPPELSEELTKSYGKIKLITDAVDKGKSVRSAEDKASHFENIKKIDDDILKITKHLMGTIDWDLLTVVFKGTDTVCHTFWRDQYGEGAYKDAILNIYKNVDEKVGQLLEALYKADGEINIVLMSDHGFGDNYYTFLVNQFLEEHGLLKHRPLAPDESPDYVATSVELIGLKEKKKETKQSRAPQKNLFTRLGISANKIKKFTDSVGITNVLKSLPVIKSMEYLFSHERATIDWTRTKAFLSSNVSQGIILNIEGRQPYGILTDEKEIEEIKQYLKKIIPELKIPGTDTRIVEKVYDRKELYSGPYIEDAPDLILSMNDWAARCQPNKFITDTYLIPVKEGWHKLEGIFVGMGPAFKELQSDTPLEMIDIAPLAMYLMGLGVPREMEGTIPEHLLDDNFSKTNTVSYDDTSTYKESERELLSMEEQKELEDKLKGLGYL